jgi:hypothetical protein
MSGHGRTPDGPAAAPLRLRAGSGRLASVKRVVLLLLAALLLMWGGVLLDLGRPARRAGSAAPAAEAEAEAEAPDERAAVPERGRATAAAGPEPSSAVEPAVAAELPAVNGPRARSVDGPMGRAELVATAARAVSSVGTPVNGSGEATDPDELLGELGEGARSPDYVELETDYSAEPRDGVWARAEERRIADLFAGHPLGRQLSMLNCQDSVCRIVLETQSKDAFDQLLEVPGLMEATGLSRQTPYSLRSGQLSVFYRRADAARASKTGR